MKNLIILTAFLAMFSCRTGQKGLNSGQFNVEEFDTTNSFVDSAMANFNAFLNLSGLEKNRNVYYGIEFHYCGDEYGVAFAWRDTSEKPMVIRNKDLLPYGVLTEFKQILQSAIEDKRITRRITNNHQLVYMIECPN